MQIPLQITFRGLPHSDALETRIREKVDKLQDFHTRITSCRVVVEEQHRHKRQGKHFTVRIDVRVPGNEIVIDRDHAEDVYVALRDAFDAAARRLEDHGRVQRGDVKVHELPKHGKVARLFPEEGYGFIRSSDGTEYYFSRENVAGALFDNLAAGVAVQFIEEMAGEGPQAKRVSLGKHGVSPE